MRSILIVCLLFCFLTVVGQEMTVYKSQYSVDETVEKLIETIKQKRLVYFETVNHDEIAAQYGVTISPTRIILFEDPSLMIAIVSCNQTTSLDLPMKILVWEENDDIFIGFFDPKVMKKRFMLQECDEIISSMSRLKIRIVNDVLREG